MGAEPRHKTMNSNFGHSKENIIFKIIMIRKTGSNTLKLIKMFCSVVTLNGAVGVAHHDPVETRVIENGSDTKNEN